MAVTNQTGNASRPPIAAAPDRSALTEEGKLLLRRRRSSSDGDSDSGSSDLSDDGTELLSDHFAPPGAWACKGGPSKCQAEPEPDFDKRAMTPLQERMNAVTMVPGMIYAVYFCWTVSGYRRGLRPRGWDDADREGVDDDCDDLPLRACFPPIPILFAAIGCLLHSSASFLYHWTYATSLPPSVHVRHWSRRLDSASIHFASACACYATSGRVGYSLLSAAFNLESGLLHAEERVRPRRNLTRIGLSIVLYVLPVLVRGRYDLFLGFLVMFAASGWLFVRYPFGGWSHSMFHAALTALPHLVMSAAMELESSRRHVELVERCAGAAVDFL